MRKREPIEETYLLRIQRFFQRTSTQINSFRYHEADAFLSGIEDELLDPHIADKIEDVKYNAIWDTMGSLRKTFKMVDDGMAMGFMGSIKKIYEENIRQRQFNK